MAPQLVSLSINSSAYLRLVSTTNKASLTATILLGDSVHPSLYIPSIHRSWPDVEVETQSAPLLFRSPKSIDKIFMAN